MSSMPPEEEIGDNVGRDTDFDISEFLGMPEYHDFELLSQNHLDTSICIYRAKAAVTDKHVIIKVCMSPNEEDNAALEDEYGILTLLKQQIAAHAAPAALRNSKRRSGSFVRRPSFSAAIKPLHTTSEESNPQLASPFPCPIEMRKVYGDQCVALVYEKFGGQTLESILSGAFSLAEFELDLDHSNSPDSNPIPVTTTLSFPESVLAEDSLSTGSVFQQLPMYYDSSIPFDHLVSIFLQLADIMDWLHRTKVGLQNFSPANILIRRIHGRHFPVVQISNFSLARKFEKLGEVQHLLDFRYLSPGKMIINSIMINSK